MHGRRHPRSIARAAFYAETDWALDISEAKLLGLRCEGVPLHLIRRDPQTQVILDKQGRYRGQQVLDQGFAQAFPVTDSVLRGFDESDTQSMLLAASLARRAARARAGRDCRAAQAGVRGRLNVARQLRVLHVT